MSLKVRSARIGSTAQPRSKSSHFGRSTSFMKNLHSNLFSVAVSTSGVLAHSFYSGKVVDHERERTRTVAIFFETMSKRCRGYPSETNVKRGLRIVHGHKELTEKLGRNDLCPCGSS